MSLRLRLIGLVAIALVLSLTLAAATACFNASRSVGIEMRAALLVGVHMVENAVPSIEASNSPEQELERLVAAFHGNRHLRVSLSGSPGTVVAPDIEKSPFGRVPHWFVRMVGVPSETARIPVSVRGRPDMVVLLETDPHNETLDTWNDFINTLIALTLFSGSTILLIHLFIGRTLRPLSQLATALEQVGQGNYAIRVPHGLTLELTQLHNSFNRMADRLSSADADNRRLNELMLTVQERERSEIARDLHDEVGPYLFAVNLDAANAARQLEAGHTERAADHLHFIVEAVAHMQRELRSVMRRLQPSGLGEFGLRDAIQDMLQFWRRRHPRTEFRVAIAAECEGLGELIDTTIYRVVQECTNNALRHGNPGVIAIRVERADEGLAGRDRIVVEIADNGLGMTNAAVAGFGLRGMVERVAALGGKLDLHNGVEGGLTVTATLPCRPNREHANAEMSSAKR